MSAEGGGGRDAGRADSVGAIHAHVPAGVPAVVPAKPADVPVAPADVPTVVPAHPCGGLAALTIVRIPALTASGSRDEPATSWARSTGKWGVFSASGGHGTTVGTSAFGVRRKSASG